jgi:hypothetical protein
MKKIYWLVLLSFLSLSNIFCPSNGGGTSATIPSVLADCGTMTGKVTGIGADPTVGIPADVNTTFTLKGTADASIDWENGGTGGPQDPVSGKSGSGSITPADPDDTDPPITYNIALTMTTSGGATLTFTGTIIGPPTCTGSGSWTAAAANGQSAGAGSWTIP